MKKLLTAKVAKESREGREESLGITLNSLGSPEWQVFFAIFAGGFADFGVGSFFGAGLLITVAAA